MKNQKLNILIILILATFTCTSPARAQSQQQEILVGDKIPDAKIREIVNYMAPSGKISDFKGKLLILDFWATYCAPCVGMFPKTDSLQKLFNGRVQFLCVTKEPKKKAAGFLNNMFKINHIKPVSVVSDTVLSTFFPYSSIPYYVWINADGKVIATTGSEEISAKNIGAVLAGKPASFENRKDIRFKKVDYTNSLFVLSDNFVLKDSSEKREEIPRKDIFAYSVATRYIENSNGALYFDADHSAAYNVAVDFLYRFYYDAGYYDAPVRGAFDSKSSHQFEISDPKLLNRITITKEANIKGGTKEMVEWSRNNAVSFEIFYPAGLTWKEKMDLVRQDLDRYFAKPMGFSVHVEKRIDSNVHVLKLINDQAALSTTGEKAEEHHDRYSYVQHNMPLSHLLGLLNSYFFQQSKISFVDKTGVKAPVDLQLSCDMGKINSINQALSKYGIQFSAEPTPIDVLVFSDAKR